MSLMKVASKLRRELTRQVSSSRKLRLLHLTIYFQSFLDLTDNQNREFRYVL